MGSGTEVEKNHFKMAVETFVEQMRIIAQEIENFIQSQKAKAAKSLTATRLENSLIFELDNKQIISIDTPFSSTTSSIALRSWSQKRKCDITNSIKLFVDTILMNSDFKEAAAALTNGHCFNVNM